MTIIRIAPYSNGGHDNQTIDGVQPETFPVPEGYAVLPEEVGTPETLENFPFGEISVDSLSYPPVVTGWTPLPMPEPAPEPENPSSAEDQYRRAVQMLAYSLPGKQALEVASIYPAWKPGTAYQEGQYVNAGTESGAAAELYRVVQDHTSQDGWPPALTPALYTRVRLDESGYPVWAPPTGAHDAYNMGDIVEHQGKTWQSRRDGNTSEPGMDEWWSLYEEV